MRVRHHVRGRYRRYRFRGSGPPLLGVAASGPGESASEARSSALPPCEVEVPPPPPPTPPARPKVVSRPTGSHKASLSDAASGARASRSMPQRHRSRRQLCPPPSATRRVRLPLWRRGPRRCAPHLRPAPLSPACEYGAWRATAAQGTLQASEVRSRPRCSARRRRDAQSFGTKTRRASSRCKRARRCAGGALAAEGRPPARSPGAFSEPWRALGTLSGEFGAPADEW